MVAGSEDQLDIPKEANKYSSLARASRVSARFHAIITFVPALLTTVALAN
jgi:hypothetical protein